MWGMWRANCGGMWRANCGGFWRANCGVCGGLIVGYVEG